MKTNVEKEYYEYNKHPNSRAEEIYQQIGKQ